MRKATEHGRQAQCGKQTPLDVRSGENGWCQPSNGVARHQSFPDVSDATREKVQKAIDALGYRPSNSARALASHRSRTIGLVAGGQRFYGPISAISSIEAMARQHGLFMSVSMVHEALCSQTEFDELCSTFDEMNVDAFIFLTPTDVMFSAACRAQITQPRVIVTSTHGSISVQDGLRLMKPADRRRVSVVGVDQWSAMADVMHLVVEHGHRSVLYFAGPKEWRDAATRLMAWNKLCAANAVSSVTVQCETWESTEAYGKMNHILENIGRTGGNSADVHGVCERQPGGWCVSCAA